MLHLFENKPEGRDGCIVGGIVGEAADHIVTNLPRVFFFGLSGLPFTSGVALVVAFADMRYTIKIQQN